MKLISNIFRVASSNIINFGSSFIVGFILPLYLSVAEYGMYKEYTLFLSFVYIFNFGYNDGIFIKYGGKESADIDKKVFRNEHTFILLFQIIVFIIMLTVSIIMKDTLLLLFSVVTLFMSVSTYHQNFLQATGDFKLYANTNIIKTIVNIVTIVFAILFLDSRNYITFVMMNILTNFVIFAILEFKYYKKYGPNLVFGINDNLNIFKIGIFVLIANMSMTFVGNVGSWMVNFGFSIEDFAQYSFSNSLLNIILLIVNSVGLIFYNVIARNEKPEMLKFTKRLLLLLGVFGGSMFFIFKFIISLYLEKYAQSLSILSITFISIPYIMVSKILISNLYKARKNEKRYFRDMILLALSSIMIVGAAFILTKSMVGIAFATMVTYILWYMYATGREFNYLTTTKKELFLMISHFFVFYITANQFSNLIGGVIYFSYLLVVAYIFKKDFLKVIDYVKTN